MIMIDKTLNYKTILLKNNWKLRLSFGTVEGDDFMEYDNGFYESDQEEDDILLEMKTLIDDLGLPPKGAWIVFSIESCFVHCIDYFVDQKIILIQLYN